MGAIEDSTWDNEENESKEYSNDETANICEFSSLI